mmetsp:Transcript_14205/g.61854  ORF Transcript_14205/g.61854 Transcript_14205/m.61854 type:complete len:385 (+) Transcript_14205:2200-3354(+)
MSARIIGSVAARGGWPFLGLSAAAMTRSAAAGSATAGRSESGRGAFLVAVWDEETALLARAGAAFAFFGEFSPLLDAAGEDGEVGESSGCSRAAASTTPKCDPGFAFAENSAGFATGLMDTFARLNHCTAVGASSPFCAATQPTARRNRAKSTRWFPGGHALAKAITSAPRSNPTSNTHAFLAQSAHRRRSMSFGCGGESGVNPLSAPAAQNRSNTLPTAARSSGFTVSSLTTTGSASAEVPLGGGYLSAARRCRPTSVSVTSSSNWLYLTMLPCCLLSEPSRDSIQTAAALRSRWSNPPACPRMTGRSSRRAKPLCPTSAHLKHARARSIASRLSVAPKIGRVPRVTSGVDRPVDAKSSTSASNASAPNASLGSSLKDPTLAP